MLLQRTARLGSLFASGSFRRLAFTPAHGASSAFRSFLVVEAAKAPSAASGGDTPAPKRPRAKIARSKTMSSAAAAAPPADKAAGQVPFEPDTLPSVSLATSSDPLAWEGDLLAIAISQDDVSITDHSAGSGGKGKAAQGSGRTREVAVKHQLLVDLNSALNGAVEEIFEDDEFDAAKGKVSKVLRVGGAKAKHLVLLGLGGKSDLAEVRGWGASTYQSVGNSLAGIGKAQKLRSVGLALLPELDAATTTTALAHIARGAVQGAYESTRFKTAPNKSVRLSSLQLLVGGVDGKAGAAAVAEGVAAARGALFTRYLVEAPPNVCTPTHLAEAAAHVAALAPKHFTLKVLEASDCKALGMGAFLGVAEASEQPPKFIHLSYKSKGKAQKKVAVVGKGLTMDTGGYNIKAVAGSMIELMKFDMGGSAATLGAARILADMQPENIEAHFIVASCENMIAGKGLRPGDILTTAAGKTIEVNNTDAEGRLTLADALWYAQEKAGATAIVDIATLTGACIIALGNNIGGLFTPSEAMALELQAASQEAGEKLWRMPMEASYRDGLKSSVADMRNTGGRAGGSITAALFLKEFINEGVEWAHMDIAGPVWHEGDSLPTGYGATTLAEWVTAQAVSSKP